VTSIDGLGCIPSSAELVEHPAPTAQAMRIRAATEERIFDLYAEQEQIEC